MEFGHKVFRAESAQGLITQHEVLEGQPWQRSTGGTFVGAPPGNLRPCPSLVRFGSGLSSEKNVKSCKQNGVKVVCILQRGGKKTAERKAYEKSPAFKNGQRFRAGIEGRISVLFRGRGMKCCLAEGHQRFELWVGAACSPTTRRELLPC